MSLKTVSSKGKAEKNAWFFFLYLFQFLECVGARATAEDNQLIFLHCDYKIMDFNIFCFNPL